MFYFSFVHVLFTVLVFNYLYYLKYVYTFQHQDIIYLRLFLNFIKIKNSPYITM